MYYVDFGAMLKKLRRDRGLSQVQLGELVGLSKAAISKYENAQSYPPYDVLMKLANTFKVSTDYLLGMETRRPLDVNGLTDSQLESIVRIINEYRKLNKL